jgi:retron-type reverse transcriptase
VNHNILLEKLASMNVSKLLWLWIRSFLTGKTQQVNLHGTLSSIRPCPLGVPQGSVISPNLFNVHINDLEDTVPNLVNINTCKYADDCTQYQIVERGTCS